MVGIKGFSAGTFTANVAGIDGVVRVASYARWEYLITQFRVLVTYIRLLFFPIHQQLDYDYPLYKTFFDPAVLLSFLFLLAVFGWGCYLFYASARKEKSSRLWLRAVSFGVFWFFATVSVESSIIPIADVIYEHRIYLPSVGFFMVLMFGVGYVATTSANRAGIIGKAFVPVMIFVVLGLSVAAYARNLVWRDGITLWGDEVRKSPGKLRPHYALGLAYARLERFDEAVAAYQKAIELQPDYIPAHNDMAAIDIKRGRLDDALQRYQAVINFKGDYPEGHLNIGVIYEMQGRLDDAAREYQKARHTEVWNRATPVTARTNLGVIYEKQGRLDDAVREHQEAIKLNPDNPNVHSNLASVYKRQGRLDDAIREYRIALQLKPDYAAVYHRLGTIYLEMRKFEEAKACLQTAIDMDPANLDARSDLAAGYAMLMNQYEEAIREFQAILQIKPDHEKARTNLAILQKMVRQRN